MMFKRVIYAKDEGRYFAAWTALCKVFSDQDDCPQSQEELQPGRRSRTFQHSPHVCRQGLSRRSPYGIDTLGVGSDPQGVRPLTARDVDKRWLADGRLDDQYPYLPIQDPLPAERRRGHPKIMPVFPKDLPRQLHLSAQPATPGQASAPAPSSRRHGNSSRRPRPRRGRKSATRRLVPSTQRIPSSFKEAGDICEEATYHTA
jgi:hypothetical protein